MGFWSPTNCPATRAHTTTPGRRWSTGKSKYLNNRAENSHQPTRQRERSMKGFRSVGFAQRFLAVFSRISPHLRPPLHRMTAADYRTEIRSRFQLWNQVTELLSAA
ncbi:DDE-type integrase/transposase/recombinase [Rhodococcus sp. NPDC059968]|uniref:DDE-type integrase/transposase/recombinase n=1 Tax=Rhodococcus sp. NPDC059968 TaxID=3347017 RepID=UPI003670C6E9